MPGRIHRSGLLFLGALMIACGSPQDSPLETPQPGQPELPPPPPLAEASSFIVSNAIPDTALGHAVREAGANQIVFISLPPKTIPGGLSVHIRVERTGMVANATMVDGGLDPVAIPAGAGDTISVIVNGSSGPIAGSRYTVPPRRPPLIVRTDPERNKRDVALNLVLHVVFSEPIAESSLTPKNFVLRSALEVVGGHFRFGNPEHTTVEFVPEENLKAGTGYVLALHEGISDLDGTALEAEASISFTTVPPTDKIQANFIHVADRDGGNVRLVAAGDRATWAPDGQRIAFQGPGGIHVIQLDGTGETNLGGSREPAWSPDGARIAFVNEEGIAVMNSDGTDVRLILRHDFRTAFPTGGMVGKPAWSPDGTRIAFESVVDSDVEPAQIFVMQADGTAPQLLKSTPGSKDAESDPAWSPDGSQIAFWSFRYGIARVPATGGTPTSIYLDSPAVHYGAKPVWSPDGSEILFTTGWATRTIMGVSPFGGSVRVVVPAGFEAAWSPDGSRIAFTLQRWVDCPTSGC